MEYNDDYLDLPREKAPYVAVVLDEHDKGLAYFNLDGEAGGVLSIDQQDHPGAVRVVIFDCDEMLDRERHLDPATAWCDCEHDTTDEGVKLGRHFIQNIPNTPVIIHYHRDYEHEVVTMLHFEGGGRDD